MIIGCEECQLGDETAEELKNLDVGQELPQQGFHKS